MRGRAGRGHFWGEELEGMVLCEDPEPGWAAGSHGNITSTMCLVPRTHRPLHSTLQACCGFHLLHINTLAGRAPLRWPHDGSPQGPRNPCLPKQPAHGGHSSSGPLWHVEAQVQPLVWWATCWARKEDIFLKDKDSHQTELQETPAR